MKKKVSEQLITLIIIEMDGTNDDNSYSSDVWNPMGSFNNYVNKILEFSDHLPTPIKQIQ